VRVLFRLIYVVPQVVQPFQQSVLRIVLAIRLPIREINQLVR
jgi:hypothetical protein